MGDPPSFFPQDYWLEANELGFLRNAFENTCAVQFHHRCLALTTLTAATALLAVHGRRRLPVESRRLLYCLCGVAWGQVGLGITTLLTYVPVHLGSAHQAGALTLMSVVLAAVYGVRAPARAATTARRAAAAAASRAQAISSGGLIPTGEARDVTTSFMMRQSRVPVARRLFFRACPIPSSVLLFPLWICYKVCLSVCVCLRVFYSLPTLHHHKSTFTKAIPFPPTGNSG